MNAIPFTPGPLRPNQGAVRGLANPPATHHREKGFIEQMEAIQYLMPHLLGTSQHFPVIFTSTGTGANEAVLRYLFLHQDPGLMGLVISNGYFADRVMSQCERIAPGQARILLQSPSHPLTLDSVERGLARAGWVWKQFAWVFVVAHETRAGLRNEVESIGLRAHAEGLLVAADAVSAAFAYPLALSPFDFVTLSSAKAVGSFPGLGIVMTRPERMVPEVRDTLYLDLGEEYRQQAGQHRPQFAQSVPLWSALHGALEYLTMYGIPAHYDRITRQMDKVIEGLGLPLVLDPTFSAKTVVNFRLPPGRFYTEFAKAMFERGFYLLCGIPGDETHFQVSTMGALVEHEVEALVHAVREELAL